jgi:hydrogenase maturation protein HypF
VLGPHVGDHRTLAARQRFVEQLAAWQTLYGFAPERLVHDAHPDYYSTAWAKEQRARDGQPVVTLAVQHHHAHVAAGMLEHHWLDRPVLGVAWDGTGYGSDGTIWGGEFLEVRRTRFRRAGHLRPFRLPGGEAAIHQPWRVALAILEQVVEFSEALRLLAPLVDPQVSGGLRGVLASPRFSPETTSAGRLFDAVAALLLAMPSADFDGQPAAYLESIADRGAPGRYRLPIGEELPYQLDWRPLLADLLRDRRRHVPPPVCSMRFHRALARGIADACRRHPGLPVVLTGGVFQNELLTELVLDELQVGRRRVGAPGAIPPNDGGLAAGQLAVAAVSGE